MKDISSINFSGRYVNLWPGRRLW